MTSSDPRLSQIVALVEATDFEMLTFWQANQNIWVEDGRGYSQSIGYLDGRPVRVYVRFAKIDGHLVGFWDCISQVSDQEMIVKWFSEVCPQIFADQRIRFVNAMNFHIRACFPLTDVSKTENAA